MRPTPRFAHTLMAFGYAGTVAAGLWVAVSAFGAAFLAEDPGTLAFYLVFSVGMSLASWMLVGGRPTVTTVALLTLQWILFPFAVLAILAPHGVGLVAYAVMGAGVALSMLARRRARVRAA